MNVLCTDLDNTIIYSYKHDIGDAKRNVEIYQEREISFITNKTFELLKEVNEKYMIIPTTTRTIEQYNRINLGIGDFKYALVCNGGILLKDGVIDEAWYKESKRLVQSSDTEIQKAIAYLENDSRRKFELRYIEELFVFTKCNEPETVVEELTEYLNSPLVNIFHNGEKVYVVPVSLSKGEAIKRLRSYLHINKIFAAGDSEFDISMVEEADAGFVPFGFKQQFYIKSDIFEMDKEKIFSESLLEACLAHDFRE